MSEVCSETTFKEKLPSTVQGLKAYALYLVLLHLLVVGPQAAIAHGFEVKVGGSLGFITMLLVILPVKSVLSFGKSMIAGTLGMAFSLSVMAASYYSQRMFTPLDDITVTTQILVTVASMLLAEGALFVVRKVTGTKISLF